VSVHVIRLVGSINAYLVEEDDGLTLIDTLVRRSSKTIRAAVARFGKPVRRIAITHAHFDHIGSIDALAAAWPDVELVIGARDAKLLRGDRSPEPGEPPGKVRGPLPVVRREPARLLAPGDTVGSLEVVGARGHSPGQVAFFDRRDGTLYCGDAYSTLGGMQTAAKPAVWWFAGPALVSWNKAEALQSAVALRDLEPARLAPGHGAVVETPGAAMTDVIRRAGSS
jgi:glyoxylase-like metal-dependent hydrolase (beta-lactamase superfamily II)